MIGKRIDDYPQLVLKKSDLPDKSVSSVDNLTVDNVKALLEALVVVVAESGGDLSKLVEYNQAVCPDIDLRDLSDFFGGKLGANFDAYKAKPGYEDALDAWVEF